MTAEMIQHKIIRCTDISWMPHCMTCMREFIAGQDRHEWRTYLLRSPKPNIPDVDASNQLGEYSYRKCGYWVTSCRECFVMNMVKMRDNINAELEYWD